MIMKFDEDTSTHPAHDTHLWLEATASDGLDMNQVYGMPMTSAQEMRTSQIVSTVDTPHSNPNNASQNFDELVQEQLHVEM